jgi:uroporphyrinogen decarboxylase
LPTGISVSDYFGYEFALYGVDTSPQLPVKVIKEDSEYIIERDSFGGIRRNHRDRSTTPEIIEAPCKSRQDWEKLKPRLEPSDRRVDWISALNSYHYERSRGKFIILDVGVGYGQILQYVASTRLMLAIIKEPDWVIDMYETDTNLIIVMCEKMIRGGFSFDGALLECDLGYKNGLFFSPRHYENQLHPVFKKLCAYFRSRDMAVILHSCGNVKDLIPYFIEEGIDCLQPLEVKAGMDLIKLKEQYGDKMSFMGGIDVRLMEQDNIQLLEEEIKAKLNIAKVNGGYIYHSDHSVPKDVSFKKYKRVIEFVLKYGEYD